MASHHEYTRPVSVCKVSELHENEMKAFDFNETIRVLLIKQNGVITAIGNKCPHYGAPLENGVLAQGHVVCPWHGACFNVATGDIEDFPGLDSLPCYQVKLCGNRVQVRARRNEVHDLKRIKPMVRREEEDNRCFVIIGGGPAGAVCAETLRQEGFTGRIVMICMEEHLPYDRVKISKVMNAKLQDIQFRPKSFYLDFDIEPKLGIRVTGLDTSQKIVFCSDDNKIEYDKCFVATGSRAVKPSIEGSNLPNVFTVRTYADAREIMKVVDNLSDVICVGSSFIATETAAYFAGKVKSITLVSRRKVPFQLLFGEEIGLRIVELFKENGVNMVMYNEVVQIIAGKNEDDSSFVKEVELKNGAKLPCTVLIFGTGCKPYTDFLKGSGININSDGSIDADLYLKTNIPDVYVGGDIANALVYAHKKKRTIAHYQVAQYHGRIAAMNMAGKRKLLHTVPFFFTLLFGKCFRFTGRSSYAYMHFEGSLLDLSFVAYYMDYNNDVVAMASCGRDPYVAYFAELQRAGKRLTYSDVQDRQDPFKWIEKLHAKVEPLRN